MASDNGVPKFERSYEQVSWLSWLAIFLLTQVPVMFHLEGPQQVNELIVIPLLAIIGIFYIHYRLLPRRIHTAAYVFIAGLVDVLLVTTLIYFSGGEDSPFFLIYFFISLAVGVPSGGKQFLLMLAEIVTCYSVALWMLGQWTFERSPFILFHLAALLIINFLGYRLLSEVVRRQRLLEAINETLSMPPGRPDLGHVLRHILDIISRRLPLVDTCILLLPDPNKDALLIQSPLKRPEGIVEGPGPPADEVPLERDSPAGRALLSGEPTLTSDVLEDPSINAPLGDALGGRCLATVPVTAEGRTLGIMLFVSRRPGAFDKDHLTFFSALLAQAATLINNALLFAELESTNRILVETRFHIMDLITDLENRIKEINDKNAELERMSAVKSQFVAQVSHELVSPINAIMNFNRFVLDGTDGPITDQMGKDLTRVEHAAQHLLSIINDILDLSRLDADKVTVEKQPFELAPCVDRVAEILQPLLAAKGLNLVRRIPDGLPPLCADPDKTRQILLNLVANAIKFTDTGAITVAATPADGTMEITVSDTGIGIDPASLTLIFEAFQQGDNVKGRGTKGVGLGLAICRRLAELMGGKIWAESALGQGTAFHVVLPALRSAAAPHA